MSGPERLAAAPRPLQGVGAAPRLSQAAGEALTADLGRLVRDEPGINPITAARRLQVRFSLFWVVLAPLLEQGFLAVKSGGLWMPGDGPRPSESRAGRHSVQG